MKRVYTKLVPKQKQKRMCQDTTNITTHTIFNYHTPLFSYILGRVHLHSHFIIREVNLVMSAKKNFVSFLVHLLFLIEANAYEVCLACPEKKTASGLNSDIGHVHTSPS